MKRLVMVLVAVVVLVPTTVWAQDLPQAEVFGGFSVLTIKDEDVRTTPVGWQAAIAANVTEMFSIVGDFGGQYKDGGSVHQFLGGARVSRRLERASVFGHALFGGSKFEGGSTEFTMGYGGGVDVAAGEKMAIRVIQFDWLPIRADGEWFSNNLRFGFGVVFKIGSK
jgi:hypothetical protein